MSSIDNYLLINLDNVVAVIDPDNKMTVWDGMKQDFYGNFIKVGTNTFVGYQSSARQTLGKLGAEFYTTGTGTGTVNFWYVSNNEFFDLPELDKEFRDFKIFYRVMAGTNTSNRLWFDYSIDEGMPTYTTSTIPSIFYSTVTLYSTGTVVGALKVDNIKIGRKGKSIKWRLREVGDGLGNVVYKVQGFANPLPYR